ncbi:phosphoglycerate dehydrogenase [Cerasicoccus arenae]|uniref:2-hydroxyacid dehydrogenase n=1 Tax=Cerasicoccus arenae TaxID=424488 RepID=A0A8J3GBX8_9BACT|nr:phosphoglycerate dehydrogenase [Cerasicoccus arenae]MBK1857018.1 phosphoglycerate dehydrogenase [Cerasicoccus arenae]GHB90409.1 2-hydroxyacid dehydrogenase [Cerasicoccus arenae]
MIRILLSTTSYQDIPGPHHDLLASSGAEVVLERGPLSEARMLELAGDFDAFLCGDDVITRAVLDKATPRLKIISKYGIGVDKIDVEACTEMGIPLSFCPGVNHTTVAEHTFALMLALFRHLVEEANYCAEGVWKRMTGHEIMGKTIGIVGLGRIGREVALRAKAFGLKVIAYDVYWPVEFAEANDIERASGLTQLFRQADILSLHSNLTEETRDMIDARSIPNLKDGVVIINCARGELVNSVDMAAGLASGKIAGYGADVLDEEPPAADHVLLKAPNCIVTPHIGSRTYESVVRQAMMATENLINMLKGEKPLAQVNEAPIPAAMI